MVVVVGCVVVVVVLLAVVVEGCTGFLRIFLCGFLSAGVSGAGPQIHRSEVKVILCYSAKNNLKI